MNESEKIAVSSRSFSRHPILREELLQKYKNVKFNDEGIAFNQSELIQFFKGKTKVIVGLEAINKEILSELPNLKVVSKYGVGYDAIDLESLAEYGVKFGWTAGVNKRSVAELTLCFILSLLRSIPLLDSQVKSGTWKNKMGSQLTGKTVGIIGCGNVGKDVAFLLKPFACKLLAHDIADYSQFYSEHDIQSVSLDELLASSDVVTVHLPLNKSTKHLLDGYLLKKMQKHAILINCARGGIVNEKDLYELLINGFLAGAAFDVFATEPPGENPLFTLENFIAVPHIGGSSEEAILAMGRAAIHGLDHAKDVRELNL